MGNKFKVIIWKDLFFKKRVIRRKWNEDKLMLYRGRKYNWMKNVLGCIWYWVDMGIKSSFVLNIWEEVCYFDEDIMM